MKSVERLTYKPRTNRSFLGPTIRFIHNPRILVASRVQQNFSNGHTNFFSGKNYVFEPLLAGDKLSMQMRR